MAHLRTTMPFMLDLADTTADRAIPTEPVSTPGPSQLIFVVPLFHRF